MSTRESYGFKLPNTVGSPAQTKTQSSVSALCCAQGGGIHRLLTKRQGNECFGVVLRDLDVVHNLADGVVCPPRGVAGRDVPAAGRTRTRTRTVRL